MGKNANLNTPRKPKKTNPQREISIMEGALSVFGKNGFEATTIADICKAAKISDATLYEYFESKEDVLFSIPELYTSRELNRLREISHYVHGAKERMRLIIQAYLEFYEQNKLYTSVALLTLKGNRKFLKSKAYQVVRQAAQTVVEVFNEGTAEGVFRDDIDPYIVRNMVLGFIEHLTIQWLLTGRPESISAHRDTIFDMVMRAIENKNTDECRYVDVRIKADDLRIVKE
jgi:TetR/AcrR family fatty acid metabolism transcriptional regulator